MFIRVVGVLAVWLYYAYLCTVFVVSLLYLDSMVSSSDVCPKDTNFTAHKRPQDSTVNI
jgi:hypothetical protein